MWVHKSTILGDLCVHKNLTVILLYRNLPFFRSQNFRLINFRVTLFSDAPRCPKIFPVRKNFK